MAPTANDIAIVSTAQTPISRSEERTEVQMLLDVITRVIEPLGIDRHSIGYTSSGSCDYLSGLPFSFVGNLEAALCWPPVYESHVEQDGAWALHEAWVRLKMGDLDTALVFSSGKSSPGVPREVYAIQNDPYYLAPIGVDPVSLAGIQARSMIEAGLCTERDLAEVVNRSRTAGQSNPNAQFTRAPSVDELLAEDYYQAPLRRHDLPPISDAAAAVVLARADVAADLCENPVIITGIDHRIDAHQPGVRDLCSVPSADEAAKRAGVADGPIDVAELSAHFPHEELLLRTALGLDADCNVNPSGGPLCGNPMMVTGLLRFIEVADRIANGEAAVGVAHAAGGQCLQQNMVAVLAAAAA